MAVVTSTDLVWSDASGPRSVSHEDAALIFARSWPFDLADGGTVCVRLVTSPGPGLGPKTFRYAAYAHGVRLLRST